MKQLIKKVYYKFSNNQLSNYQIKLAYIFYTEKIYDDQIFKQLLLFCSKYYELTGSRPICTIIPPTNLLLKLEMEENRFSEIEFINRIKELKNYATIGYHGHFYQDNNASYHNAIHCNNFKKSDLESQFTEDISWFKKNNINHNGIYAAGWWFMNEVLMGILLKNGFKYDFSFSKSPYFYNPFSVKQMNDHQIKTGEVFEIGSIKCIQNLIGMHGTQFPQDFDRNLKNILNSTFNQIVGVVNSHDYDLDLNNTINCIEYQIKNNQVKFYSFENICNDVNSMDTRSFIA